VDARTEGPGGYAGTLAFLALPPGPPSSTAYPGLAAAGERITAWTPLFPGADRNDDGYADVTLPFAFPYDGSAFSSVRVYTDGHVSFVPWSGGTGPARPVLGGPSSPNAVVAPYWTDLRIAQGGSVSTGTLPDGRFVIEYDKLVVVGREDAGRVSFLITLSPSGEIELGWAQVASGLSALIRGAEGVSGGTAYRLYGTPAEHSLYRLVPLGNVIGLAERVAVVPPQAGATFNLTFDTAPLRPGRYTAALRFDSNAQLDPSVTLPVVLHVTGTDPEAPPPPEDPSPAPPASVDLRAAWPNPVRRATSLRFGLPADAPVRLAVYDVRGREVAVLAEGDHEAGWYDAPWTPVDASGVYIVRLVAGQEVRAVSVVVVR
ncbi:MAG TPA: T9SS type A sorting domain-containing protein, partial [Rubricoccaceae bacterium]